MNRLAILLLCSSLVACGDDGITFDPEAESFTAFQGTLDGWVPEDVGLAAGSSFQVTATQTGARFDILATEAGGAGVLTREYILTPGVDYLVAIDMVVESSDGGSQIEPWSIVVGTSVEGGPFELTNVFSTQTTGGATTQAFPLFGNIAVTAGPPESDSDVTSPVRVAIGFQPESADERTYRLREVRVRITREDSL
ncbi:MAG TPA: hypothetical protein VJ925_01030 [Longimicrobiales bacterium]|nr:hypothetical protein [Longimicrobiales bacterium]